MTDREIFQTVVAVRRAIHRYPELGRREFKTTDLVVRRLRGAGIPVRRFRPTGAVAMLSGRAQGPCVALRADLDALPLEEAAASPFRSRNRGVMHACGHDAHTAMVLTAALALAKEKSSLPGTVKLIFQPDEEGGGGALDMIRQGALSGPRVEAVFGLHVNPRLPAGTIGVKPGPLMAAVDRFELEIQGEGGHGAYPHEGRDAVVMAAHVVSGLQTVVSRRVDPVDPVVLTIGTIQGGRRFNVLAESVTLTGTVRTLRPEVRRRMPGLIREMAAGVVKAHGGRYRLDYHRLSPPLINDEAMAALARGVAERSLGPRRTISLDRPSMGGEDFSEFVNRVPGCFAYLGTGANAKTRRPWHHPSFFLHEESMVTGVKFLAALAREALGRLGRGTR